MITNYYVFDLTRAGFCARSIGSNLRKGEITYERIDKPMPICSFKTRTLAIAAAIRYGLKRDKFTILSERV